MPQSYPSRSAAERAANRQTANGTVHKAVSKRGLFSTKHTVQNTHRVANPVERRIARNNS